MKHDLDSSQFIDSHIHIRLMGEYGLPISDWTYEIIHIR